MKLYLSSIDIPSPKNLAELLAKSLEEVRVAIIPNAQDYYSTRAWNYKVGKYVGLFNSFGSRSTVVDLRDYSDAQILQKQLLGNDLIWVTGGNTFCLRYEMRRSGFEKIISALLEKGVVFGGDSAGALVAGLSIAGIESADIPEFAEEIINDGLNLVPYTVLPHADNSEFAEAVAKVESMPHENNNLIKLKDSQAVIFDNNSYRIVDAPAS
jgi:dipeptidase E